MRHTFLIAIAALLSIRAARTPSEASADVDRPYTVS
jgi:hypothetical protein